MNSEAYTYLLPPEKIAQRPVYPYHAAKMLAVDRKSEKVSESSFLQLLKFLSPKDLLVFNDTKVIPARLFGKLADSKTEIELLLTERINNDRWRCIGRPLRKLLVGTKIIFSDILIGEVIERPSDQEVVIVFSSVAPSATADDLINQLGLMPIPPYIREGISDDQDRIDYQTMFAEKLGSIAAPTASLHFTPELLAQIKELGCRIGYLTLHVGSASILTIERQPNARPSAEQFQVSNELLNQINKTRDEGGRVIAVGTTVVRALETSVNKSGGRTELFITPGYTFSVVDAVITNFHQPGTTHLLLVEAWLGRKMLEESYQYALQNEFRFLSYGDGMLLL